MPIRWLSRSLFGDAIKCVVSSIRALVLLHTPSSYGILVVSPSLNSQYKWVSPWCLTRPAYCAWSRHFDGNTKELNWNGVRSMKKWDTVDCARKYYLSPPRGGAREFLFPRLGPRVLSSSPVRWDIATLAAAREYPCLASPVYKKKPPPRSNILLETMFWLPLFKKRQPKVESRSCCLLLRN